MAGKTVRIAEESYLLLLQVKSRNPGMSLSDLADVAVQKTYGEGILMATDTLSEEYLKVLTFERDSHRELLESKDTQIRDLKETLERERKLVDLLTNLIENVNVPKDRQIDTQ